MRYLVIGSGGREHAIFWRLLNDGSAAEVYVAPGNGGIHPDFCVNVPPNDFPGIEEICRKKQIDLVIIGPEAPLVEGIVDYLEEKKIPVFGPSRSAAMLEGSKLFAKNIMNKYGIPTAQHREFTRKEDLIDYVQNSKDFPMVIKLDGLAAGKGVAIPGSREEAINFIHAAVSGSMKVFVEDFIEGEEASVLGISDGTHILNFIAAQDHKRVFDGDRGPNTGGMGAYAPAPVMTPELLRRVHRTILQPTINGMLNEGIPFKGILYAGIITNGDDIKVLEYNARFGDPETQVLLPLLNCRLGDLFQAAVTGKLDTFDLAFKNMHAITVVVASAGYPGDYEKGKIISGLSSPGSDITVFHAGTKFSGGNHVTNGGRVLNVTALGNTLREARDTVYNAIDRISFNGAFYRKDIGYRAL